MANTTFTNNVTVTDADWFNDLNRLHYTIFGDPADVIHAIDALHTKSTNVASAATLDLTTATGDYVHVTGTTTITAITLSSGNERTVIFDGALTLTHNATSLILPGAQNITTVAGDMALFRGEGSGNVRCVIYQKSAVQPGALPAGIVAPYAGSTVPSGWLLCYGQTVSRTTYANLFSALGTTHGAGDGSTTFGLPDLRGRSVFGKDDMGGAAANRVTNAVSGITAITLGASGGDEHLHQHTHTATSTVTDPGHTHTATVTDPGHTHTVNTHSGSTYAAAVGGLNQVTADNVATSSNTTGVTVSNASNTTGVTVATSNANSGTGSSQNMPPALVLNYIISY